VSETSTEHRVARWRLALGVALLIVLTAIAVRLTPLYFKNLELQRYVSDMAQSVENQTVPDVALRTRVLEKAQDLQLPVVEDNVQIRRSGDALHIDVRYVVKVDLPLYTVDLHFYPGAGSR